LSKVAIKGATTGSATFTIESPATNTDRTLTLPDAAGTVALTSDIPTGGADVQTFNASGTWTKPASGSMARIQVWGGGGGGARNSSTSIATGGGGGGYNEITVPLSTLGATESVTIGAGGLGRTASAGVGTSGGSSTFGSVCFAGGGFGGVTSGSLGAQGGSPLENGVQSTDPAEPIIYDPFTTGVRLQTPWHGGPGTQAGNYGPGSLFGGGGGNGANQTANYPGGKSAYGGNGGDGGRPTTDFNGTAPGGGGGGRNNNLDGGNGAAGRVIVTVW